MNFLGDRKVVFKHHRNNNIGDFWSCPAHYYSFGEEIYSAVRDVAPQADLLIAGGGTILTGVLSPAAKFARREKPAVLWGVGGMNVARLTLDQMFDIEHMSLLGSRDIWDHDIFDFVPCVSCKSELFDRDYEVKHEIVYYKHSLKGARLSLMPEVPISVNHDGSLEEAIEFIGSAETVVTSSYHGVYWAMLLGKKVACAPFGTKFDRFEHAPFMVDEHTPQNEILKNAVDFSKLGLLERYRDLNDSFAHKVAGLVG